LLLRQYRAADLLFDQAAQVVALDGFGDALLDEGLGVGLFDIDPFAGLLAEVKSSAIIEQGGNMKERIAVNPEIHFGKPCVAGTRIPVQAVLELVREGLSFSEIIQDYYPDLEVEDIRACIQHAIDVVAVEDIHLAPVP